MLLELNNIEKKYDKILALDNVSVMLKPGVYGLLGANGAGKTTLLRVICGVIRPTKGKIHYNGKHIFDNFEDYRDKLGFLPQDFRYYPEFTGMKFMLYIAALKGLSRDVAKSRCLELLVLVGLDEVKNKKIRKYSGGMKQRLGIAQALVNDPDILILDEPTVGLDPKERNRFRNLISTLSDDKIVILSTHIVSDVEYIADEILIFKKGRLEDRGVAKELLKVLENRVWECVVGKKLISEFEAKYIVCSEKNADNGMGLRLITNEKPLENAVQVEPKLEDLYLYYFKDEGVIL